MKHLKGFNESSDFHKVTEDEINKMVNFIKDNNFPNKNPRYFHIDKMLYECAYLYDHRTKSTIKHDNILISNELMNRYNEYVKLVDEYEFIEDCLIDLIDEKYKVTIAPGDKHIYIDIKSFDDMGRIYNDVNNNKLRFTCVLVKMIHIENSDFYRIQLKYTIK